MTVYFDNSATTRVCAESIQIMNTLMDVRYGNPSSSHHMGRDAKGYLDAARRSVARALGAEPEEILFVSGGTEADNWALFGGCERMRHRGRHIISTMAEHDAVRKPLERLERDGWEVTLLRPDKNGSISAAQVEEALRDDTALVSVMLVNNETGAVNPVNEIARTIKKRESQALLHTDAVQAFCKLPFTPASLGADMISVSSHKLHGPKGVGALYIRKGLRLPPLLYGGGQEGGYRSGTENLPAIAGFGEAARVGALLLQETQAHLAALKTSAVQLLREQVPEAVLIGEGGADHILCISLPDYKSEVLRNCLDADGICVSKGSACKKGARSHVLEAMGLPVAVIDGSLRLSFSRENTLEEIAYFIASLRRAADRLQRVSGGRR